MKSPAGSPNEGQTFVVHGTVAAFVRHPDGYAMEILLVGDVNVSLSGATVGAGVAEGGAVSEGDGDGDGDGDGAAPTDGAPPGCRALMPTAPTAMTTAAATASLAKVLMGRNLHGRRTRRCGIEGRALSTVRIRSGGAW